MDSSDSRSYRCIRRMEFRTDPKLMYIFLSIHNLHTKQSVVLLSHKSLDVPQIFSATTHHQQLFTLYLLTDTRLSVAIDVSWMTLTTPCCSFIDTSSNSRGTSSRIDGWILTLVDIFNDCVTEEKENIVLYRHTCWFVCCRLVLQDMCKYMILECYCIVWHLLDMDKQHWFYIRRIHRYLKVGG